MSWVAQKSCSNRSVLRLIRFSRIVWVKMIAQEAEADDHRPGPDAGQQQAEHDGLDDDVRLQEQVERRHGIGGGFNWGHLARLSI